MELVKLKNTTVEKEEIIPEKNLEPFQICISEPVDVTFVFKNKENGKVEECYAHKNILSQKNAIFKQYFNDQSDNIKIDNDKNAFIELLRYIYTNEVNVTLENASNILRLAKEFMISKLEDNCKSYLRDNMKSETTLKIYEETLFDRRLTNWCINYIADHTNEIISSKYFYNIKRETLSMILKLDISTVREYELFERVYVWTILQCKNFNIPVNKENKRAMIGDMINLIRFPTMTSKEFASCVELDPDLLTNTQILEIQQLHNRKFMDICSFSYVKRRISQRNYMYIALPTREPLLMIDNKKIYSAKIVRNSLMNIFKCTIARNTVLLGIDLFCPNADSYTVIVNYDDVVQHQYITAANCKIEFLYPITVDDGIPYEITLYLPQMKYLLTPQCYNANSSLYTDGGMVKGIYIKMPEI